MDTNTTVWVTQINEMEGLAGDRRFARRYEIDLEMRWKLIRRKRLLDSGVGRTIDLSSGGIQIETGRQMPVGLNVELSITWPVRLHNVAPLQLIVSGRIVRSAGNRAGIRMVQHEFRTVGVSAEEREALATASRSPSALFTGLPGVGCIGKIH